MISAAARAPARRGEWGGRRCLASLLPSARLTAPGPSTRLSLGRGARALPRAPLSGSAFGGPAGAIDYTKMMKSMGAQQYYSLEDPVAILPKDEAGFTAELGRLGRANDPRQMLNLLTLWSRSSGLPVRQTHCQTLLEACLKAKDVATTNAFIMGEEPHASNPDILRRSLRIFGAAGATAEAHHVLELLSELGETIVWNDYNLLMNAAASSGDIHDLLSMHAEMRKQGIPPALSFYNLALKACVTGRTHGMALQFFDELTAAGLRPDRYTWGSLIQSYIFSGDVAGANGILARLLREKSAALSPSHCNHVMKAHADAGDAAACFRLLEQMQTSASRFIRADEYSYAICLNVAAAAGDKRKVIELVRAMYGAGLSLNHATWRAATAPFGRSLDADGLREVIGRDMYCTSIAQCLSAADVDAWVSCNSS
jgi:pentatricopeptide repeat protein